MRRLCSLWFVAGVVLLLAGCIKPEFKEQVLDGGRFKVLMPGTPVEHAQKIDGFMNKAFLVELHGVEYGVVAEDTAPDFFESEDDIQSNLDVMVATVFPKKLNGVLNDSSKITLDEKYPGREAEFYIPEQRATARARMYFVAGRLYTVMVTGPRSAIVSPDTAKFLDSFELLTDK